MVKDAIAIENERKANKNLVISMAVLYVVLIADSLYTITDYYSWEHKFACILGYSIAAVFMATAIVLNFKLPEKYFSSKKYLLALALLVIMGSYSLLYVQTILLFPPLALGLFSRYYDRKFMKMMIIITGVMIMVYTFGSIATGMVVDMNVVSLPKGTEVKLPDDSIWLIDALPALGITSLQILKDFAINMLPPFLIIYVALCIAFLGLSKSGNELIEKRTEEARKAAIVDRDLSTAMNIQTSFLSTAFEPFETQNDIEVFASMKAARQVGGDFYDFCNIDETKVFFVMGDVSGKGIPAALFMVKSQACLHELAYKGMNPAEILTQANNILIEHNSEGFYVTLWIGILDKVTGELQYANAGHVPPYICRRSGEYEELSCEINFVCGMMPDMEYVLEKTELHSGDRLYTCTDGVTDCSNTAKEFYGVERLHTLLNELKDASCKETVDAIDEALLTFQGEAEQFDDITMMVIKRH